jgi:hypothetical protein
MAHISRILVVDSDTAWHEALSKSFEIINGFNRFQCAVDNVQSWESAKKYLDETNYDMVVLTENLGTTSKYRIDEGLHVLDYLNSKCTYTRKILINACELESQKKHYNMLDKYKVDNPEIFVKPYINIKNFIDLIIDMIKKFQNGYALLIGVGYNNALPATVNDAKDLHDLLIDPRLAAYPRQQVQVLTEKASTKDNILSGLKNLADQVRENSEATVWIYYSGHGFLREETHEYFLVPYGYSLQSSQEIENTCISNQDWGKEIKKIKAKKLMVWLDCCHAGGMLSKELDGLPFRDSPPPKGVFEGLTSGSGRVVVASCKENQKSYILPRATNSVFTTCLLEVLQGQGLTDSDDEYIRFFQIMSHLYDKVPELVKTQPQNPILVSGEGLDENFAVCYRPQQRVVINQPSNQAPQNDIKLQSDSATNQAGDTSISLEQSIVNQLQEKLSQLTLLDQKISKLERAKITTSNPMLEFDLDQNILKLKEDRGYLNKEIEDLNKMLS